jgi:hypothetical protein
MKLKIKTVDNLIEKIHGFKGELQMVLIIGDLHKMEIIPSGSMEQISASAPGCDIRDPIFPEAVEKVIVPGKNSPDPGMCQEKEMKLVRIDQIVAFMKPLGIKRLVSEDKDGLYPRI